MYEFSSPAAQVSHLAWLDRFADLALDGSKGPLCYTVRPADPGGVGADIPVEVTFEKLDDEITPPLPPGPEASR